MCFPCEKNPSNFRTAGSQIEGPIVELVNRKKSQHDRLFFEKLLPTIFLLDRYDDDNNKNSDSDSGDGGDGDDDDDAYVGC